MSRLTPAKKGGARRGAPRRVSDSDVAEMVRLRSNGLTYAQIGEQLGIEKSTIGIYLRAALGAAPQRMRKFTAAERQFIADHVREGWSVPAIAEALGRTPATVISYIRREQLPYTVVRARGHRPTPRIIDGSRPVDLDRETRRRIVSVARRTGTLAGTAREVGIDGRTVERVLEQEAPVVLHAFIRGNVPNPGAVINNWVGDLAKVYKGLSEHGLDTRQGYDDVVQDYGADQVHQWLDRLERDRDAIRDLSRELRHALERHEKEARP